MMSLKVKNKWVGEYKVNWIKLELMTFVKYHYDDDDDDDTGNDKDLQLWNGWPMKMHHP